MMPFFRLFVRMPTSSRVLNSGLMPATRSAFKPRFFSTPPASSPASVKPKGKFAKYALLFAGKPVSYFTSFLILHEITAVLPVAGIFWYIHTTSWTPPGISEELVKSKMEFAKRWTAEWGLGKWFEGDKGARMLLELGTAYAVVKVAMPIRMAVSIAGAPLFARWAVEPIRHAGIRIFKSFRKP
ncbi:hypothetical protein BZA77DRAFT_306048 [Pyronema omphalodes]|nr:hypothetical protein BZA77DRAFT_306048 [Pyronema omphalodes]